ncbi:GyrI-like domain-containing protein [Planctomonas deserti]|uniref:GyrI-like domain-containing protein n=1 Tax=Planctomonas deserti TaxID=2144185 RepID=UPI000D3C8C63|nr:GyrI-like domain-containing protein [Planctomonas deserti]
MFEVLVREVPEQTVLAEQRHVTVDAISGLISEVVDRQRAAIEAAGGSGAAPSVIYHGVVDEVADGPVEVCTPVDPALLERVGLAARVEPAHREAYVSIPKPLVEFPAILTAYDAVEKWIGEHGETIIGSPREVYFGDFEAAGPEEPVVDIAFPIASR